MVKFSELTLEQVDLLSELMMSRARSGQNERAWTLYRQYLARRVPFLALEGEIVAGFHDTQLLADYYEIVDIAQTLSDMVPSSEPLNRESFEPALQEQLPVLRKLMVWRMVHSMGLVSTKELASNEAELRPRVEKKTQP
jgi:hypothetical protein